MSMLDSFFSKGFKGAKCKTLLKLTIPRIKLLRNRREIQLKQMRRDIAKLLENGQEATARIRVEHIIREENMMAAQEIMELFCELIAVRLPIIEIQRECPLDLKEAISSICFAAPRCSDLPELQQVQMLFAAKYGKEFVAAASELMPECGVNRQIIELLSVRAPSVEAKLKLLKEIAEEHELDWDPAASETEFLKPHEDLLNGPVLPLPKEKHDVSLSSKTLRDSDEESEGDAGFDSLDLPEVPRVSVRASPDTPSAPEIRPPHFEPDDEATKSIPRVEPEVDDGSDPYLYNPTASLAPRENKQFIPFALPPFSPSDSLPVRQSDPTFSPSKNKSEDDVDLPSVPSLSPFPSSMPYVGLSSKQNDPAPSSKNKSEDDVDFPSVHSLSHFPSSMPYVGLPSKQNDPAPYTKNKSEDDVDSPSMPSLSSFISSMPSDSFSKEQSKPAPFTPHARWAANEDLEDVLAAAHAAAESAERAAAAARSAASLAQVRITELITKRNSGIPEGGDASHGKHSGLVDLPKKPTFDQQNSFGREPEHGSAHPPERLSSLEDDPYFSYPNLFTSPQDSRLKSDGHSFSENS